MIYCRLARGMTQAAAVRSPTLGEHTRRLDCTGRFSTTERRRRSETRHRTGVRRMVLACPHRIGSERLNAWALNSSLGRPRPGIVRRGARKRHPVPAYGDGDRVGQRECRPALAVSPARIYSD